MASSVSIAGPSATQNTAQVGRTAEFRSGQTGGGPVASSLNQQSVKFNSQIPKGFDPGSVLDAYQLPNFHPQNGNSAFDASRQTPAGQIPTPNSQSMSTWELRNPQLRSRLAIQ